MAASRSWSAAGTGAARRAASTEAVSTHSHWQAAFSRRRRSALSGAPGMGARATFAPWWAIGAASWPSSASSARFTRSLATAGAQGERYAQPWGPGAKWVCSRSRPAVREVATWSRHWASGLADGAAGHLRPLVPGPIKYPAELVSASRACPRARSQGPVETGVWPGTWLGVVAMSWR